MATATNTGWIVNIVVVSTSSIKLTKCRTLAPYTPKETDSRNCQQSQCCQNKGVSSVPAAAVAESIRWPAQMARAAGGTPS